MYGKGFRPGPVISKISLIRCLSSLGIAKNIVVVGGPAAQVAFLDAIQKNYIKNPEHVQIVGKSSWLTEVEDEGLLDKPWGQTLRVLPSLLEQIIVDENKGYPRNELLTFRIIKKGILNVERKPYRIPL